MSVPRNVIRASANSAVRRADTGPGSDKRERVLAVAADLFHRHGFPGTTMDMICAELGVSKPFVYYYFHDKNEIAETLAWRASVACLTTMKFPPDDARPAHLRLADGLHRWVAACVENFRGSTLAFRVTASLRPEFSAELRRLTDDFYADLGALMNQARDQGKLSFEDTTVTALAMGGVVGFMYTWYRPDGRLAPDELVRRLTTTLYKMIGLRRPSPRRAARPTVNRPRSTRA
jgi:AcrR family transcriptional regulator